MIDGNVAAEADRQVLGLEHGRSLAMRSCIPPAINACS
jgi:hypothetical protein